jgi:hypothetical protein
MPPFDDGLAMHYRKSPKMYAVTLFFGFLTGLASIPAYYQMFTGFSKWDDEGALMVTVKQFLGGMKLYNQIAVPYGPVYYFYNWAVRTFSATAVTHDAVRMSSLLPWLLTALVSAWIVFRLTESLVLSAVTHLLVFLTLSNFFPREPGHPQELCILLLVCISAAGVMASIPRLHLVGMILLGTLTASLALVKVNIGTFAFLATSLAILAHSPKTKLSRFSFVVIGAASVFLPVILMKGQLSDPPTRFFAALVSVSMIAALLVLLRVPRVASISARDYVTSIVAFVATFVVFLVALKIQGVGPNRTLHALLLDSLGPYMLRASWYMSIPLGRRWYFLMVGGLFLAGYISWSTSTREGARDNCMAILKLLLAGLTAMNFLFQGSLFGLVTPAPFFFVPPLCWLVLYRRPGKDEPCQAFPRTLLCLLTILQALYAYPIAGSQFYFVQILLVIVVMLCLGDFIGWARESFHSLSEFPFRVARLIALVCVAAFYIGLARTERKKYNALPFLQLPGSTKIHLPEAQARDYLWLVRQLNEHCDIFVGLPEVPSLHIWTGKDPLDGMQMDDWMLAASNQQQLAVSTVLSAHANACEIYNPDLVTFWNRNDENLDSLPLVRYLHENFKVAGTTGKFVLLVRNGRVLSIESDR